MRLVVTGTPQPSDRIARFSIPAAEEAAAFAARHGVSALVWADGALDPLFLDAAGLPLVVLPSWTETCRIVPGPIARRALGEILSGHKVLAGGQTARRRLQRDVHAPVPTEVSGPLQEAPPLPEDDEPRRSRLTAALEGRPVWFAVAVPPEQQRALVQAQSEIVSRSHRALLVLESEDGIVWEAASAPGQQERVLRATGPEERGLWFRIASVTLMGDSFEHGGRTDPLAPAALGSAVVHGPATGLPHRSYARLETAGGALRIGSLTEVAGAVDALLVPDRAAVQAAAAWEEVTRGAEATDRAAQILVDILEAAGAL